MTESDRMVGREQKLHDIYMIQWKDGIKFWHGTQASLKVISRNPPTLRLLL